MDISIIIPAFHEEQVIASVVEKIHGVMSALSVPYEILVINDGSQDNTARQAEQAGARVVSHPYNIGNGAAAKTKNSPTSSTTAADTRNHTLKRGLPMSRGCRRQRPASPLQGAWQVFGPRRPTHRP
ncbi:MAG: glycosyltransferase [Nitrospira sp.]|nr:glycosyltransferase [Nitrospira sp.]